jgi:hypothetical protein
VGLRLLEMHTICSYSNEIISNKVPRKYISTAAIECSFSCNTKFEFGNDVGIFTTSFGNFSLRHRVHAGSGAHPTSYPMGKMGSFPGGKATGI